MAHKTLIGGTAYEISGGKTLIGGTAYSIDKGKTLVGGTAYEVGFAEMVMVTIEPIPNKGSFGETISFNAENASVVINGIVYDGSLAETLIVPIGTIVDCVVQGGTACSVYVYGNDGSTKDYLNGNATYQYEITGNTLIQVGVRKSFGTYPKVDIYEQ